jgi:signal transduction histidine kinase
MIAPMKMFTGRIFVSIGIVLGLTGILATLAVLQYRWSGEISDAERARMQSGLRIATAQFRQEFNADLQQLGQSFQPDGNILSRRDWQSLARRLTDVLGSAEHHYAGDVHLWTDEGVKNTQLLKLDRETKAFRPAEWPADMEPVRTRYAGVFSNFPRQSADLRPNSWVLISEKPLLIHPLVLFQPLGGPPVTNTEFLGFIIVGLNLKVLQSGLLAPLAQKYFSGPDGLVYQVAVVSAGTPGTMIYQSDPGLTPGTFASPDARIPLLDALWNRLGRRGGGPGGDMRPSNADDPRPPPNLPGRGRGRGAPLVIAADEGANWELLVKHKVGSLEAVVSGSRRRNLAISFGILLLLACSIALIIAYTQRMQRLARLQMDFVAGFSHELRTPLAVICSAGDNLAVGVVSESSGQVRQYGNLIRDEGRKLSGMVEQILQFTGMRDRRRRYHLVSANIDEIVEETLKKALPSIQAVGFVVEKAIDPGLPPVRVDAQALTQCIQNLIDNALKYSGDSRWLAVRVQAAQGKRQPEVLVTVEDRGMGIEQEDIPHIFDPFYRGRAATVAQIHGTGLGLCMAREAITAMGGSITVRSAPGKGSAFVLHLPAFGRAMEESTPSGQAS